MAKHGKRLRAASELIDRNRAYPIEEEVAVIKRAAMAKFDETLE